jgi:competence protein ComEA
MWKKTVFGMLFLSLAVWGMTVSQVNRASKEDLMKIKGIGEKKAEAILKERKKKPFESFEDIEKIKGIGPVLVENIKKDVYGKSSEDPKKKSSTKKDNKK